MCMSALSPSDLFSHFDKEKLIHLAKFYPDDFVHNDMAAAAAGRRRVAKASQRFF
jgi:hypothetical protein